MGEDFRSSPERHDDIRFKDLYGEVHRILALTDAPELMEFGVLRVDRESAVEEGLIRSDQEFKPMLRGSTVEGIDASLRGVPCSTANFLFRQGGYKAMNERWVGRVQFWHGADDLVYDIFDDGNIEITETQIEVSQVDRCSAQPKDKHELLEVLRGIKEELYARKIGGAAVTDAQSGGD